MPKASALAGDSAPPAAVRPPTYILYAPSSLPRTGPLQLLIVLHGMGSNAQDFAPAFMPLADRHGWLLAAPTFNYGDWRDPNQVRGEDVRLSDQLEALIADAPVRFGRPIRRGVLLAGFSRGAQLADRFAYFHPEQLDAVASLSAGTYTVPSVSDNALAFPFGTADLPQLVGHPLDLGQLRRVPFWLSVGADDNNPSDVPRQWDGILGRTRLERAEAFTQVLQRVNVSVQLTIFTGAKHQVTSAMTMGVDTFFGGAVATA